MNMIALKMIVVWPNSLNNYSTDIPLTKEMHEFKEHKLHSGSKKGPVVSNPKQAIAIALSEARKLKNKKS